MKKLLLASAFVLVSNQAHGQESPAPVSEITSAEAQKLIEDDKAVWSIVWENDIFSGTDKNYSNGARIAWNSAEANAPDWLRWSADWLPINNEGNKRISAALGQNIYTPEDKTLAAPNPQDRPYAGWLYGSVGISSDTGKVLDNVMLTLGVVGPSALGEQTQDFVHDAIDDDIAQGWDNQLEDEPGFILSYERKWRSMAEWSPFGLGADVTPHVGFNLGNVNTSANAGATLRIGYDLPQDYGPPRIRPSLPGSDFFVPEQAIGGYLFATVEGRGVARDIFLDGNTFKDSPSVDKENFVGSLNLGVALTIEETRISYTHAFLTEEFETQREPQQFGIVSVSHRF